MDRKFMDGECFADDTTKTWVETQDLLGSHSEELAEETTSRDDPWGESTLQAKQHAAKGEFELGIRLFRSGAQTALSERERFHWLYEQAKFCMDCGHHKIALPQLASLYESTEKTSLSTWEPELFIRLIKLLINCYDKCKKKIKYTAEQLAQIETLRVQLCLHDPLGALSLN